MKTFILGLVLGSALTTAVVGAQSYLGTGGGNYLAYNETQAILGEIRIREALETVQMLRQHYLDQQIANAGKTPCQ